MVQHMQAWTLPRGKSLAVLGQPHAWLMMVSREVKASAEKEHTGEYHDGNIHKALSPGIRSSAMVMS